MMGAIVFALMSACSNDEPNIPDDNDNPNPGNTEEPSELLPRWEKVFSQPMQGTDYPKIRKQSQWQSQLQ